MARFKNHSLSLDIRTQKLLCGNITKLLIAKNGFAHCVQRTRISLGFLRLRLFDHSRFLSFKIEK